MFRYFIGYNFIIYFFITIGKKANIEIFKLKWQLKRGNGFDLINDIPNLPPRHYVGIFVSFLFTAAVY